MSLEKISIVVLRSFYIFAEKLFLVFVALVIEVSGCLGGLVD